jgi:hypothetical protein
MTEKEQSFWLPEIPFVYSWGRRKLKNKGYEKY